ncbi:MAG: M13-type metalloendopeptidase [Lysobacteraceae bacterium]
MLRSLVRSPLCLALGAVLLAGCQPESSSVGSTAAPAPAPKAAAAAPAIDLASIEPKQIQFHPGDLDASVSACTDLNAYVNSKWLAANPVPGDRTTWGSFEVLGERSLAIQHTLAQAAAANAQAAGVEKLVGDFYASGMDEAAIEKAGLSPIQPILDRIAVLATPADVAAYLGEAAAQGRGALFRFGGAEDFRDSSQMIAYASQGGLSLPERAYYLEDRPDYQKARQALADHMAAVFVLAGETPEAAQTLAGTVVEFETRLARASTPRVELRDPAKQYQPATLEEADALTPNFSWGAFFDAVGVARPPKFSLTTRDFFKEANAMLADMPVSSWQAYLRYHEIDGAAPYLSNAFATESFNFYSKALRGQAELGPRWKRVMNALSGALGEPLGQLYVKAVFPPESKAKMQALVGNLSKALKQRIEGLEWMGPETKAKALEKWASFTPKIGYPDKWQDYSSLALSRQDYAGNVLKVMAFETRVNFDKIGKPVDRSEWHMSPQTVNAYYNPSQNEIVFPAGILQPPFFDPNADDALNYGGIVAVIGHEMIHGYDDQGSQFDAKGNFENWWTDADREGFTARTGKLVAQFDGYESIDGIHVNGTLTLGENIADLGGIATAYDAMKAAQGEGFKDPMIDGFTQEQRLFLNWATVWRRNFTDNELKVRLNTDPHSPAAFRAIGAPSNLPAFAQAFGCKDGDGMMRSGDARVEIW